jgi:tripartite-type tricarboxylate transporter receptor subunit TctC
VPTLDESGLSGYQRAGWNGVLAPAGVNKDIIARLNALIVKIVNSAEIRDALGKHGYEPQANTPAEFAAFIRNELAQNAKLVKFAGLKVD